MIAALALAAALADAAWSDGVIASGWTVVGTSPTVVAFERSASPAISPAGYRRRWVRYEYESQQVAGRLAEFFLSSVALIEFDCANGRQRQVQGDGYYSRNLQGETVIDDTAVHAWEFPIPGTYGAIVQARVCAK